jgi:hypothetical protein
MLTASHAIHCCTLYCTALTTIHCRYEEGEQLLVLIRDKLLPSGKGPYHESAQDNVRVKVTH